MIKRFLKPNWNIAQTYVFVVYMLTIRKFHVCIKILLSGFQYLKTFENIKKSFLLYLKKLQDD